MPLRAFAASRWSDSPEESYEALVKSPKRGAWPLLYLVSTLPVGRQEGKQFGRVFATQSDRFKKGKMPYWRALPAAKSLEVTLTFGQKIGHNLFLRPCEGIGGCVQGAKRPAHTPRLPFSGG